jgi:hypothetical protein
MIVAHSRSCITEGVSNTPFFNLEVKGNRFKSRIVLNLSILKIVISSMILRWVAYYNIIDHCKTTIYMEVAIYKASEAYHLPSNHASLHNNQRQIANKSLLCSHANFVL